MWGVTLPGLGEHLAPLDLFLVDASEQHPDVVPGLDLVQELAEHLQVGGGGLSVSWIPTISISSIFFSTPRLTRPVTTVPRPVIEKTSSIAIKKGLSTSRSGWGM